MWKVIIGLVFVLCLSGCGAESKQVRWSKAEWYTWLVDNTSEETHKFIQRYAGQTGLNENKAYAAYAKKHGLAVNNLSKHQQDLAVSAAYLENVADNYAERERKLADAGTPGDLQAAVRKQVEDEKAKELLAREAERAQREADLKKDLK